MTIRFDLQRSGHHYQNYKIRCSTVQIMHDRGGITAVWPDCICYCCLARLHLLLLSGQTAFVSAVWPDCICYCCLARLHLLLLSGQTAFVTAVWPDCICTLYSLFPSATLTSLYGLPVQVRYCLHLGQYTRHLPHMW